jgi:cytochrome c553
MPRAQDEGDSMTPPRQPAQQRGIRRKMAFFVAAILLLIALTVIQYGPELLDYHRFEQSLNRIVVQDTADGGAFPRLPDVCVICHGFKGNALNTIYPRLAGQPASYLKAQLRAYASGQRTNPSMVSMALSLTGAEGRQVADYFSRQRPAEASGVAPDAAQRERAIAVVKRLNCAACHGTDFAGHDQFPRLGAQNAGYLAQQLEAFKRRERRDPTGVMNLMVDSLTPQDILDVAQYLSHLKRGSQDASP